MGLADAAKVKLWQITSSPLLTPSMINAKWMAAVPDDNATACTSRSQCVESHCDKSCSKPSTFGPKGTTQLVSKASRTNSCSDPPMCANDNQILLIFSYEQKIICCVLR